MSQRLAIWGLQGELASGLWPSTQEEQIPFWRFGQNVVFRDGGVQAAMGWRAPFTSPTKLPVRGLVQQRRQNLTQRLYYGDAEGLYMWALGGSAVRLGGGFQGIVNETATRKATHWSMLSWGDWVLATNGVDPVQWYDGSTLTPLVTNDDEPLPFSYAEILMKRGPHVLAINTSNGYNWVEWCSQDDVRDWEVTPENSAGSLVLRDLESPIIAACELGDRIALYGSDSMHIISYIGAPSYFGWVPALNGIGAVSKHSVVAVGRRNFGFGRQGFWMTDGVNMKYIDDPAMRAFVQNNVNWDQISKVCGYHNEDTSEVRWFLPFEGSNEPNKGFGFNYNTGLWTIYGYGRTSAIERQVFKWPVAGDAEGRVYFHEVGHDAAGEALRCEVISRPVEFGNREALKYIDAIKVGVHGLNGRLFMQIGMQDRLSDRIRWSQAYVIEHGNEPIYPHLSGRWITFKFWSEDPEAQWSLHTIAAYGRELGSVL